MSSFLKFLVLFIALIIGAYLKLSQEPELPELDKNDWWGPGSPKKQDTSIRPFEIKVPKEVITELQTRLKNHRPFTSPLEGIQHEYGMNTELLEEIINYWATKYNWTEREKYLNQYPQFKTQIQGLDIHFLRIKPKTVPQGVKVLPLLILHGWPGSVVEFYEAIPFLTTPRDGYKFVFEVIAPSLPGFGFSQGSSKPGLSSRQMAVIFNILMERLGFDRYYVQGGDWGSMIGTHLGVYFPDNVKGIHLNMCVSPATKTRLKWFLGSICPSLVVSKEKEKRMYPVSEILKRQLAFSGYLHLQATKPDSIGVAFSDSPSGLAAYILEKFTTGTNSNYELERDGALITGRISIDKLLDNLMFYYIPNSMTTAMRIYAESFNSKVNELHYTAPVKVPTACLSFEHEIVYQPESFLRDRYHNLVHYAEYDDGGHFAALELPEIFTNDVWEGINKMENLSE